ncbi:MAG: substrate-binding domain-containing protein [Planctomycetota bacterium]
MDTLRHLILLAACALACSGCFSTNQGDANHASTADGLIIYSGSENKGLEPLIQRFARYQGLTIDMQYKGSVDIALDLEQGTAIHADAVWPANSLWLTLGDLHKVVKHEQSIMTSPVVFGVKRSVAEDLGWVGAEVSIQDILAAAEAGKLRFAMTSATQSNSGASAYFGFLHAMAGQPPVLTAEHLADKQVQQQTARLLKLVNRSSGSSGWLKELMIQRYDDFDAMVNYEAMVIEANRELERHGHEPLIAIYPIEGIMMADSPLGYIDKGDADKAAIFNRLMTYLQSPPVQDEILALGRRTGLVGLNPDMVDEAVFNPAWAIDVSRVIAAIPTPAEPVIRRALDLYQGGGLRKPSATAYVLDFSGSMGGEGEHQLKQAMGLLLDPTQSKRVLLQASQDDLHIVVPFDSAPRQILHMQGNAAAELHGMLQSIRSMQTGGGTNIYTAAAEAVRQLRAIDDLQRYNPAVILMTDGRSDGELAVLHQALATAGPSIPVFSIAFGDADDRQLRQISDATGARVFHSKGDLRKAFRKAKGYN